MMVHELNAQLRALRRFGLDLCLGHIVSADNPGALPGAARLRQKILVAADNTLTLTLCWQAPQDAAPHNFTLTTQIQG